MLRRVAGMTAGARAIALPTLPDDGAPAYDHDNSAGRPRRPGVRVHPGCVPRPDGGCHRALGYRRMDAPCPGRAAS